MKILIGSSALKKFDIERNEPKDLDYFTDDPNYINGKGEDHTYLPTDLLKQIPTICNTATPDAVYTIKCSHLGWDIHWEKTKADILWLRSQRCNLIPDLFDLLYAHWQKENGNKEFLSLKKSKEEFFTDHVDYKYDHDYLHELVAYPDIPLYQRCLQQGEEVLINKASFDSMAHKDRVRMLREEITVIAVERWVIPLGTSWFKAYILSLKKTIVSLTKGWATEFIVTHLDEFVTPDFTYFKHLLKTLNLGNTSMDGQKLFDEMLTKYTLLDAELDQKMEEDEFISEVLCSSYEAEVEWNKLYSILEDKSGGEGEGEYCYIIFKYEDKIYKAEFSYRSYTGHDYGNFVESIREVTPSQKTITVYE